MTEEDEHLKNLNSQIKQLESEKSKYIEQKRKEKAVINRTDIFMQKFNKICNSESIDSNAIAPDLEDVRDWFYQLFNGLYDMQTKDTSYENLEIDQTINEAISSLSERKNTYSINIDILIASLEKMRPKKKEGK